MLFNFSAKKLKQDAKSKKAKPDHLEDIPFRLREIMKSKERMKTGSLKPKKPKQGETNFFRLFACMLILFCLWPMTTFVLSIQATSHESKPGEDGDIPVLHFKRGKQESEKAYVRRMENETKHIHFLTKNQVDRQPELDDDNQDKSTDKGKSEKKKEWVHSFLSSSFCVCADIGCQWLSFLDVECLMHNLPGLCCSSTGTIKAEYRGYSWRNWTDKRTGWRKRCS